MCLVYGAGAALVLDEFALWLNLQDVYWARQGRASLDAILFRIWRHRPPRLYNLRLTLTFLKPLL